VTGGTGGSAGSAGACNSCEALETCFNGTLCVTKLVVMPEAYVIDATEVTRGQYEDWLATTPSTSGQAPECSWNTVLQPDATCMSLESVCSGADCDRHPQVCVDMCDAAAYCMAVGKRLCGRVGGGTVADEYDCAQSELCNACSSGGVNDFAYGNTADASMCNDYLSFSDTTVPVASFTGCQSPIAEYAGVFDLIGNVEEWEDNCFVVGGEDDICHPRGLPFGPGAAMPGCGQSTYGRRNEPSELRGFRCCATAVAPGS
jgi:formylglycine-generating enzyme required for sulfatase activity